MKKTNVGIIGYGSMGKMLFNKFRDNGADLPLNVFISNRTKDKLNGVPKDSICTGNAELVEKSDLVFICVRPVDMKAVFEEIKTAVTPQKLIVSLNGSVSFENIGKLINCKTAKVIPSVTAEINKSQTLVCYNPLVMAEDKILLSEILKKIGNVIELPENEMGMGSELVSCMPGFIASIFDVICNSSKAHTQIPADQIINMVLETLSATSLLMLKNKMSFEEVVERVATKGGITQEGTSVVYNKFPAIADELFEKTLEKRRITAENAERSF